MSQPVSLSDYAKSHEPAKGPPCWACSLPELAEVDDAIRNGISRSVIAAWLRDVQGHVDASTSKISHHARNHVL